MVHITKKSYGMVLVILDHVMHRHLITKTHKCMDRKKDELDLFAPQLWTAGLLLAGLIIFLMISYIRI